MNLPKHKTFWLPVGVVFALGLIGLLAAGKSLDISLPFFEGSIKASDWRGLNPQGERQEGTGTNRTPNLPWVREMRLLGSWSGSVNFRNGRVPITIVFSSTGEYNMTYQWSNNIEFDTGVWSQDDTDVYWKSNTNPGRDFFGAVSRPCILHCSVDIEGVFKGPESGNGKFWIYRNR